MIKIDFSTAISLFLSLSLVLVFAPWIFYNYYRNKKADLESNDIQQCPYCGYIFFDYQGKHLNTCPRCLSLITKEEDQRQLKREKK